MPDPQKKRAAPSTNRKATPEQRPSTAIVADHDAQRKQAADRRCAARGAAMIRPTDAQWSALQAIVRRHEHGVALLTGAADVICNAGPYEAVDLLLEGRDAVSDELYALVQWFAEVSA